MKKNIADHALQLIEESQTIFLDGSSISHHMLRGLSSHKHLTVVSNSASICYRLAETGLTVYGIGGMLAFKDYIYVGSYAEEMVMHMQFDSMFFSSSGVSMAGKITGHYEPSVGFLQKVIQQSEKVYYMADSSRIGRTHMHTICDVADVDRFLCDSPLPDELAARIGEKKGRTSNKINSLVL